MIRLRRLALTLTAVALVVSACSPPSDVGAEPGSTSTTFDPGPLPAPSLTAFDACESFLDYVISHAVEQVGPYGLGDPFHGWFGFEGDLARSSAAFEETAATTLAGDGSGEFSGTNVQALGVDEPDMVKTNGERIVVLSEGTLIVADVTGDQPVVSGRLHLGSRSVSSLFLSGDRVLLFGSSWTRFHPLVTEDTESFAPTFQSPSVELIEVDISGEPEVVRW